MIDFLAYLTLFTNIFIILSAALFLLNRKKTIKLVRQFGFPLSFLITLTATAGSLYLSEVAHFTPCKLCWFQRIFMYPLPIILATAYFQKIKKVFQIILPLTIIGGFIAFYHYYLQINPDPFVSCGTIGFSVSCSERFFTYFGYITIPFMSATAFTEVTLISLLNIKND